MSKSSFSPQSPSPIKLVPFIISLSQSTSGSWNGLWSKWRWRSQEQMHTAQTVCRVLWHSWVFPLFQLWVLLRERLLHRSRRRHYCLNESKEGLTGKSRLRPFEQLATGFCVNKKRLLWEVGTKHGQGLYMSHSLLSSTLKETHTFCTFLSACSETWMCLFRSWMEQGPSRQCTGLSHNILHLQRPFLGMEVQFLLGLKPLTCSMRSQLWTILWRETLS